MGLAAPHVRHWSREEYLKMGDADIFTPEELVELIEGEILAMTLQTSPHSAGVRLAQEALRGVFGAGFDVRPQLPLSLGPESEPQPDVAVVRGAPRDYVRAQPTTALLVDEVADETLAFDRGRKAGLYAKAGIPEHWILNLADRVLEVYRRIRCRHRIGPPNPATGLCGDSGPPSP